MCLIVVAHRVHDRYPLIVLANRDEFHARPAAPVAAWDGDLPIAAGRDLQAGGTWMGALPDGSFAAVTNARVPGSSRARPRSRGSLPVAALAAVARAKQAYVPKQPELYAPFGLLVADSQGLRHGSNWFPSAGALAPGVHVLSNGAMNAPWPKAIQLRQSLNKQLKSGGLDADALFHLLREEAVDPSMALPDTGVGPELERRLAPPFICDPVYGTRASTILRVSAEREVELIERRFDGAGKESGETTLRADGKVWRQESAR